MLTTVSCSVVWTVHSVAVVWFQTQAEAKVRKHLRLAEYLVLRVPACVTCCVEERQLIILHSGNTFATPTAKAPGLKPLGRKLFIPKYCAMTYCNAKRLRRVRIKILSSCRIVGGTERTLRFFSDREVCYSKELVLPCIRVLDAGHWYRFVSLLKIIG